MSRLFFFVFCSFSLFGSSITVAQDASRIFQLFQKELERHIDKRKQRQNIQGDQEQYRLFIRHWKACFSNDIKACDEALRFPNLTDADRTKLHVHREKLLDLRNVKQQRRVEEERQIEQRRRAEAVRRAEDKKRITKLELELDLSKCQRFIVSRCDAAKSNPYVTQADVANIDAWLDTASKFKQLSLKCQNGVISACDDALSSDAVTKEMRPKLVGWRAEATWFGQSQAFLSRTFSSVEKLPASTIIIGSVALFFAAALVYVIMVQRNMGSHNATGGFTSPYQRSATRAEADQDLDRVNVRSQQIPMVTSKVTEESLSQSSLLASADTEVVKSAPRIFRAGTPSYSEGQVTESLSRGLSQKQSEEKDRTQINSINTSDDTKTSATSINDFSTMVQNEFKNSSLPYRTNNQQEWRPAHIVGLLAMIVLVVGFFLPFPASIVAMFIGAILAFGSGLYGAKVFGSVSGVLLALQSIVSPLSVIPFGAIFTTGPEA